MQRPDPIPIATRHRGALRFNPWIDNLPEVQTLNTRAQKLNHITRKLDDVGFDWQVVIVAWSGFFTDSFNLFSVNVTLPVLAALYWPHDDSEKTNTLINCLTLAGNMVGQVGFGFLADVWWGRQRLYGAELVLVLIATVGIVEASQGADNWMSIQAQICFWRFFMGVGIGAEYPLSAVLTSEWASREKRGRMFAAVFSAQPIGQLCAALVGLWVLLPQRNMENPSLDKLWRIVSAVGAIPALFAIFFRFTITDPGRWTLDVRGEDDQAVNDTLNHIKYFAMSSENSLPETAPRSEEVDLQPPPQVEPELPIQFSYQDLKQYFITEHNWRYVAGTSACWFLLDLAFFGLGMNNPRTLATIWEESTDDIGIRDELLHNAKRSMLTVSLGSLLGIGTLIYFIERVSRRKLFIYSFLALAGLFVVSAISFERARGTKAHILTIVLCGLCQFVFNFGPNALTFIIPAEIFPTRYRGSCHGLAAASGKLGSIVVQVILFGAKNWVIGPDKEHRGLGYLFLIFGAIMASGAIFAAAWLPEVQRYESREINGTAVRVLVGKELEVLAEGIRNAREEGEPIQMGHLVRRAIPRRQRRNSV